MTNSNTTPITETQLINSLKTHKKNHTTKGNDVLVTVDGWLAAWTSDPKYLKAKYMSNTRKRTGYVAAYRDYNQPLTDDNLIIIKYKDVLNNYFTNKPEMRKIITARPRKPMSAETKAKIAASKRGRKRTEDDKIAISNAMLRHHQIKLGVVFHGATKRELIEAETYKIRTSDEIDTQQKERFERYYIENQPIHKVFKDIKERQLANRKYTPTEAERIIKKIKQKV